MSEPEKLTVQVSLIRKAPDGGISSIVEHPVEHTYKSQKAARGGYEFLAKLFRRISAIPEVADLSYEDVAEVHDQVKKFEEKIRGKLWHHFDGSEVEARVSILAVDEDAARGCLRFLLLSHNLDGKDEKWPLHSATYNRDGSPVL
uniref:Uncharacterized protein n=1 Tax=viral metagenome TaxID=1070528 RepID=A0A6M3MH64_9ZZZZ